jgi:hypothetical protein
MRQFAAVDANAGPSNDPSSCGWCRTFASTMCTVSSHGSGRQPLRRAWVIEAVIRIAGKKRVEREEEYR